MKLNNYDGLEKSTGDARRVFREALLANLRSVEGFSFDLAAFDDVGGQRLEDGLLAEAETESFHMPSETPLAVPHVCKRSRETLTVPPECGPLLKVMYIQ